MNIFYIDYENVNSFGLKGVQLLHDDSQVNVLYSKKADNVKIDALSELMRSKADIHFIPVHVGTPNALDFQLITLLFLNYQKENHYYIISKDSGYDCCIKTAQDCGAPNVRRFRDIESALHGDVSARSAALPPASLTADEAPSSGSGELVCSGSSDALSAEAEKVPVTEGAVVPLNISAEETAEDTAGEVTSSQETAQAEAPVHHSRRRRRSSRKSSAVRAADSEQTAATLIAAPAAAETVPDFPAAEAVSSGTSSGLPAEDRHTENSSLIQEGDARFPFEKISEVISKRCGFVPDERQLSVIRDVLQKAKNKQQFYTFIVRRCRQKEGLALYHTIRCAYNDLLAIEAK